MVTNMEKPYVVGMDIGGTNTVFGIVDQRGNVLATDSVKTQSYAKIEEYVEAVPEKKGKRQGMTPEASFPCSFLTNHAHPHKKKRRKSPIALVAFGMALAYCLLFGALYALLAEPLYYTIALPSLFLTNAAHSLIVAVIGTALCCLLFLLKDKRIAPSGFAGLLVILCMFYAGSMMQQPENRSIMLPVITTYGLAPVLVGNAVTWPIYLKFKRANPAPEHKKTIQEEFREALANDKKFQSNTAVEQTDSKMPERSENMSEDMVFGAEPDFGPASNLSAEKEALLFYEEEDDD